MCAAASLVNGMLLPHTLHIQLHKKGEKSEGFHVSIFSGSGSQSALV